jgi:ectoine hydroxylase-related dioxygenase (phytanoyl-CoA dioxygenase family)
MAYSNGIKRAEGLGSVPRIWHKLRSLVPGRSSNGLASHGSTETARSTQAAGPSPAGDQPEMPVLGRLDTEGQHAALLEHGCYLVKGVLEKDEIQATRAAIDALEPINWDFTAESDGRGVDHYKNVFNRSPFWLPYLDRAGIVDTAERALGRDCHITGMTAWRGHPGCGGLPMHADRVFFPVDEALLLSGQVTAPMLLISVFYYLTDITRELCPTYVILGSHKAGIDVLDVDVDKRDAWRGRRKMPVLCSAGDVLVMRSELWHSGSSNTTRNQVRHMLQVHYGNRFIAQRFTPYMNFRYNPDVIAAATPRQLRLLGDHVKANYD